MTNPHSQFVVEIATRMANDLAWLASPLNHANIVQTDVAPSDRSSLVDELDKRVTDSELNLAVRSRWLSGHYADAVETAVKVLNQCIRRLSGRSEDGDSLMTKVFSPSSPILRVSRGRAKEDESLQRGHMQLCQGVVGAWRNPRAHNVLDDSPDRTLMMLDTINDLMIVSKACVRTRQRKRGTSHP